MAIMETAQKPLLGLIISFITFNLYDYS